MGQLGNKAEFKGYKPEIWKLIHRGCCCPLEPLLEQVIKITQAGKWLSQLY